MESQANMSEMTFRDYLRILFRQQAVILLCFVVVSAVAFVQLTLKTPVYQAQVKMLISAEKQLESPYYQQLGGQRGQATVTQSEVVTASPVLERTVSALHLHQRPIDYEQAFASPLRKRLIELNVAEAKAKLEAMPRDKKGVFFFRRAVQSLRRSIAVLPIRDTNMFTISVTDYDPLSAAIIANVVSRSYVIFDLQQQLAELELRYGAKHPTVLQLKDYVQIMIQNLSGQPLPDEQAIGPASVKIIEQASIPISPNGASKKVVFAMAALMGLLIGTILAFIFEYMDQTIKSPRDLEVGAGLAHLGGIPRLHFRRKTLLKDMKTFNPNGAYPSAMASLADQIRLLINNQNVKSMLFVEPEATVGISTIISDLGFSLAEYGDKKILVVNANFRQKTQEKSASVGLVDILIGKTALEQAVENAGPNLWILPGGKTSLNPMTFLDSPKAKELFQSLRSQFDVILVEGPDLKNYKDSLALSANVDGVVLVVAESMTRLPVVKWVLKPLRDRRCNVLGAILNRRKFVIPRFIYNRI